MTYQKLITGRINGKLFLILILPTKQKSRNQEIKKSSHPKLIFNNNHVVQTPYQKYFGLILNGKLSIYSQQSQYLHWDTMQTSKMFTKTISSYYI